MSWRGGRWFEAVSLPQADLEAIAGDYICRVPAKCRFTMEIHSEVDACGLRCPLPILRAKKALAQLGSGQRLKVTTTDAGAARDFAAFARQTGHALLEQYTQGSETIHILQHR